MNVVQFIEVIRILSSCLALRSTLDRSRCNVFWRRFLGLFPVVVIVSVLALFFDFDEKFLSVRTYLCSIPCSYECLYFFPVLSVELQAFIRPKIPSINLLCSYLVHLPLNLESARLLLAIFETIWILLWNLKSKYLSKYHFPHTIA